MKILIASDYFSANYYVKSIVDELGNFTDVVTDVKLFWESKEHYSIIHIQWPEELFAWNTVDKSDLNNLKARLNYFKKLGTKIVVTYHNSLPHRNKLHDKELYQIVIQNADAIIHLAQNSTSETPNKHNVVIEHPSYGKYYKVNKNLEQKGVYFSFGNIRNIEEEWQIINGFIKAKIPNSKLYVANSLISKSYASSFRSAPLTRVKEIYLKYYLKIKKVFLISERLNDEEVEYYFNKAHVIITPRIKNLNSGVIYMGFTFGKVVLGPAIGNIKEHLEINKNPTFIPNDINSIALAFMNAYNNLESADLNLQFSKTMLNPSLIAKKHLALYSELTKQQICI